MKNFSEKNPPEFGDRVVTRDGSAGVVVRVNLSDECATLVFKERDRLTQEFRFDELVPVAGRDRWLPSGPSVVRRIVDVLKRERGLVDELAKGESGGDHERTNAGLLAQAIEGAVFSMGLQPGQVVWLNSGSPALTVVEVDESRYVPTAIVSWSVQGHMQTHQFPLACLRVSDPRMPGNLVDDPAERS